MKTIVVDIDSNGKIKMESKGFLGGSCIEATRFIEEIGKVVADEKTAEFYITDNEFNKLNVHL